MDRLPPDRRTRSADVAAGGGGPQKRRARRSIATAALACAASTSVPAAAGSGTLQQGQDLRLTGGSPAVGPLAAYGQESRTDPLCNVQATPSLAAYGQTVVAAWVDDRDCDPRVSTALVGELPAPVVGDGRPFSMTAFASSTDGGRTWTAADRLRSSLGGQVIGDPVLAVDRKGVFYLASRATANEGEKPVAERVDEGWLGGMGTALIGVGRSEDGGRTFLPIRNASHRTGTRLDGWDQDRPWIAVDTADSSPFVDSVYVTWTEFWDAGQGQVTSPPGPIAPTGASVGSRILFSRSTNGGKSFLPPVELSAPGATGNGTQVVVGPHGEIFVAWADFGMTSVRAPSGDQDVVRVWFTRSLDGGATFSAPTLVAQPAAIGHLGAACFPPEPDDVAGQPLPEVLADGGSAVQAGDHSRVLDGEFRVANWVSLAVDNAASEGGPMQHPGRLYLAVPHRRSSSVLAVDLIPADLGPVKPDESDIALLMSDDGGRTWQGEAQGEPTHLVNDTAVGGDQFHPRVVVGPHGQVVVSYYERLPGLGRAGDQPNATVRLAAQLSIDGGQHFGPVVGVSDATFTPPTNKNPFRYARAVRTTLVTRVPPTSAANEDGPTSAGVTTPPIRGGWGYSCSSFGEYHGLVGMDSGEFLDAWGDNRGWALPTRRADGSTRHASVVPDLDVYLDRLTDGD